MPSRPGTAFVGCIHLEVDRFLWQSGPSHLGPHGAERAEQQRRVGGVHPHPAGGSGLLGVAPGAQGQGRAPGGRHLRLRRQQAHAAGLRGSGDVQAGSREVRPGSRVPLVLGRLLRQGLLGPPAAPRHHAASQRGHLREAHVEEGHARNLLGLEVWRGLRSRHHRRLKLGCDWLDGLELALGEGGRPEPRRQRLRRAGRGGLQGAGARRAPAVLLHRPLLQVLHARLEAH
mmetsp:Transcript_143576/g.357814  ORF Transcript_143576/g.357814 Transcript_143576/m.357814 type:complete len:230 (-) Transcript_143576:278-967(-)